MKVILISGKARAGKDTSASYIKRQFEAQNKRCLITHNADLLKYICKSFFNWDGNKDEAGRSLLQFVGTDVVREQNPSFWVDFIIDVAKMFPDQWDYIIVPDSRFPNELSRWEEEGFDTVHVRIERDMKYSTLTEEQRNHPSETALDDVIPDCYVANDGSLECLYHGLDQLIDDITNNMI